MAGLTYLLPLFLSGEILMNLPVHPAPRMLLGLPWRCSASKMFADSHIDGFHAIIRKKAASLLQRLRNSANGILKMIAARPDCPIQRHWVEAMTDDQRAQIHKHFEVIGMECIKDHTISEDDIMNLRGRKLPSGEKAPCFLACMMRNIGVMNDNGMLQKESALELARKVFNDDEEVKKIEDYMHSCSHINSEAVSDGDKGCERAFLAYKCMMENAPQFGFDV
ncbi:general odorant-binding protein 19d [Aphomia sociella]